MALVSVAAIIVSFQARNEKGADAIALSAGIVGSLLLAPYIHIQDLALLLLVVWLFLRSFSFRFWPLVVCALVFAANLEIARTTVVPAGIETLFLLLLLTLPFWKARWVSNEAVAVP